MKVFNLFLFVFLFHLQLSANQLNDSVTNISIKAIAGMQFDLVRFNVKPGAKVKLVFSNADDMSHNLLITKPGTRMAVINAVLKLEEKGPQLNYIPQSSDVLWSVPVLSPDQSQSIVFKAPSQPGAYPYVCTYPGHGFIMYGVMYVTSDGKMPDMKNDPNIPPSRQQDQDKALPSQKDNHASHTSAKNTLHPYEPVAPYLYRIFMEDAGPAAIAVRLPKDLSYCWDAGTCRLRYAWSGGFVDNTLVWKGHTDANAKILGTVFYRDQTGYPLRIGTREGNPEVEYKGYRLINRYPEFHYTVDGKDVYELILPKEDGNGLKRSFRIPEAGGPVWFLTNQDDGSAEYEVSAGTMENGILKLSAEQAREFSVTMTNYSLVYARKRK